jgi:hypothetical protein
VRDIAVRRIPHTGTAEGERSFWLRLILGIVGTILLTLLLILLL